MANPNIVDVSTILANNSFFLVSSTADPFTTALVNNPASSGKVYKVNTLIATNVDTANSRVVTIKFLPT